MEVRSGSSIRLRERWHWLLAAAVLAMIAVGVRTLAAEPRTVSTGSMQPTLAVGDKVVVEKVSFRWRSPRCGEIVAFEAPPRLVEEGIPPGGVFIKRVIALPGQQVQVHAGQVLVDGQPLDEPYLAKPPAYEWGPRRVPEGMLFVLGDNRNGSADSHVWGWLPRHNVVGRVWLRVWPAARMSGLARTR